MNSSIPHLKHSLIRRSGGVGVMVVQVARFADLRVSATCSADKKDLVRSLGASQVFDYKKTPLESLSHDYDIVIDCVGGETLKRSFSVLRGGGTLIRCVSYI